MSITDDNKVYAKKLKDNLMLRSEPVAIKLVRKGEAFPDGYQVPEKQMSHCQAVMSARNGNSYKMTVEAQMCHVGAATLGMVERPEKVISGEFHAGIGIHEGPEGAKNMIAAAVDVPFKSDGEIVCPLKDANFEPDVVAFIDIPERIYWFEAFMTRKVGGRVQYSTAPFQCACEDITAVPIVTGKPNISIGCFGCRKKTDMKPDEMAIGVPYSLIPEMSSISDIYKDGVFTKAKRD